MLFISVCPVTNITGSVERVATATAQLSKAKDVRLAQQTDAETITGATFRSDFYGSRGTAKGAARQPEGWLRSDLQSR